MSKLKKCDGVVLRIVDKPTGKQWQNTYHYPFDTIVRRIKSIKKEELE